MSYQSQQLSGGAESGREGKTAMSFEVSQCRFHIIYSNQPHSDRAHRVSEVGTFQRSRVRNSNQEEAELGS